MKILILVVCLTLCFTVDGLKCFRCRGSDCDRQKWDVRDCDMKVQLPGYQNACMKVDYIDYKTQKRKVERKCIIAEMRGGDPYVICPTHEGYPVDCPVCTTDLCNSSPRFGVTLFTVFAVIVLGKLF